MMADKEFFILCVGMTLGAFVAMAVFYLSDWSKLRECREQYNVYACEKVAPYAPMEVEP